MASLASGGIRPSAVAGLFYPEAPETLGGQVDAFLAAAARRVPADAPTPKALIAPHAGYVYSGAIAGSAYARLRSLRDRVRRVVLLGPAHRFAFRGLAVPSGEAFDSPLGPVPLDREGLDDILGLPGVGVVDEAHRDEHALEVQLPFLQRSLGDWRLVPVVVGDASPEAVASVLERLWGGAETLIVISSDLSHYHHYSTAQKRDAKTSTAIESLASQEITAADACGARPINGLLRLAQARDMRATTLDLRNSGDTAGPRDRVVGYGAWSLTESEHSRIPAAGRLTLLSIAARAIRNGLNRGSRPQVRVGTFGRELEAWRGSFVTLTAGGRLRGCIGSILPQRALVADVAWNAYSAAFEDPRFQKLTREAFAGLALSVSVLSAPQAMRFADEAELLAQLRPGRDGLILSAGQHRAVFLPQVWAQLAEPPEFLGRLKRKAGLAADAWPDGIEIQRFGAESFASPVARLPI